MAGTYLPWNGNNNNNNRKWSECEVWYARTWVRSSGWNEVMCYICIQCSKAKLGISRLFEPKSSAITLDKKKALSTLLELKEAMPFRGAARFTIANTAVRRANNWNYEVLSIIEMLIIDVLGEQCQSTHKLSVNNLIDCRGAISNATNAFVNRTTVAMHYWWCFIEQVARPGPDETKTCSSIRRIVPLNNWEDYAIPFREVRARQIGVLEWGASDGWLTPAGHWMLVLSYLETHRHSGDSASLVSTTLLCKHAVDCLEPKKVAR